MIIIIIIIIRAQPLNDVNPLTRESQHQYEQPGCVHSSMDLFKYAYQLYPYIDSNLLIDSINLALYSRKIDMLASPYDISKYTDDEPIKIETIEGRKKYIIEQEKLMEMAIPIRKKLYESYKFILDEGLNVNVNV